MSTPQETKEAMQEFHIDGIRVKRRSLKPTDYELIVERAKQGLNAREIAQQIGVSIFTISIAMKKMRDDGIDIPSARKGDMYKAMIARWRKEKPQIFNKEVLRAKGK